MSMHEPFGPYEKYFKRPLDFICALLVIVLFCWVFLILAVLVKVKLGSPVIYSTKRVGRRDLQTGEDREFKLYKFRSMTNETDENGKLLPDVKRLTKFGRILRASSLDELPEVFNILKGDMSLFGPRPLPGIYLPYYTKEERHRHDVRPGLSGLAQVSGRNAISWDQKFRYDVQYVQHITFIGDVELLFRTIKKVFVHEGIGQGEQIPPNLHVERAACERTPEGAVRPQEIIL